MSELYKSSSASSSTNNRPRSSVHLAELHSEVQTSSLPLSKLSEVLSNDSKTVHSFTGGTRASWVTQPSEVFIVSAEVRDTLLHLASTCALVYALELVAKNEGDAEGWSQG